MFHLLANEVVEIAHPPTEVIGQKQLDREFDLANIADICHDHLDRHWYTRERNTECSLVIPPVSVPKRTTDFR